MPKRKTDPQFPKAARLKGLEKAVYLDIGELDPAAKAVVTVAKSMYWKKVRELKKPAIVFDGKVDAAERAAKLTVAKRRRVTKYNMLLSACGDIMICAILNNDAQAFRHIAEVIEQHKANGEIVVDNQIRRRATNPLAHYIACWAMAREGSAQKTFAELWSLLEIQKQFRYGKLGTAARVKAAKAGVLKTAKRIGIIFAPDRRGPK